MAVKLIEGELLPAGLSVSAGLRLFVSVPVQDEWHELAPPLAPGATRAMLAAYLRDYFAGAALPARVLIEAKLERRVVASWEIALEGATSGASTLDAVKRVVLPLIADERVQAAGRGILDRLFRGGGGPQPDQVAAAARRCGLPWPCSRMEIDEYFRARVHVMHPDRGGSPAAFAAFRSDVELLRKHAR